MKIIILIIVTSAVAYGPVPKLDGKIVGGHAVNIVDFPYQVSVRYYDQHICGGTIFDETTIITAAHCVYGMDHSKYSIRAGSTIHSLGQSYIVSEIKRHISYDPFNVDNDIAILKLGNPLWFSDRVQPVRLQNRNVEVPAGTTAWVSGWGFTYEGSQMVKTSLRAVNVKIVTNNRCIEMYGPGKITSHMLCAHTVQHDSCQGDSGGPLVANGKLIGVVSWGYGCARPNYPGVYTKISDLYPWIIANI